VYGTLFLLFFPEFHIFLFYNNKILSGNTNLYKMVGKSINYIARHIVSANLFMGFYQRKI
tara:strand:+ start:560 stop:739 length:180 start_codon:yes stop_codon:yes gene_type:complete